MDTPKPTSLRKYRHASALLMRQSHNLRPRQSLSSYVPFRVRFSHLTVLLPVLSCFLTREGRFTIEWSQLVRTAVAQFSLHELTFRGMRAVCLSASGSSQDVHLSTGSYFRKDPLLTSCDYSLACSLVTAEDRTILLPRRSLSVISIVLDRSPPL